MWEFIQSYGIWSVLGIAALHLFVGITALYLFAGGCGRGAGMDCGGYARHSRRQGERRPSGWEPEVERDEEIVASPRNGQPHH
jgi:hypothetical protein